MENSFLESLINKDKELLIYLNNLGSEQWDSLWLFITNQFSWIPLFAFILFLIFKKFGLKKGIFLFLFLVVLVAFSDQFTNLVKNIVGRIRPCNDISLQDFIRQLGYKPGGKSFWSGHASLSSTFTTFIILLFRKYYKFIYLMILFPILFGYSRIYLAVHFPLDVTCGYISGVFVGYLFYKLYQFLSFKYFNS